MRRDYVPLKRSNYQGSSYAYVHASNENRITGRSSDHSISLEQVSFHEQASRNIAGGRLTTRQGTYDLRMYSRRCDLIENSCARAHCSLSPHSSSSSLLPPSCLYDVPQTTTFNRQFNHYQRKPVLPPAKGVPTQYSNKDMTQPSVLMHDMQIHSDWGMGVFTGVNHLNMGGSPVMSHMICVFFTSNRSFYPSASSTPSARADSSSQSDTNSVVEKPRHRDTFNTTYFVVLFTS